MTARRPILTGREEAAAETLRAHARVQAIENLRHEAARTRAVSAARWKAAGASYTDIQRGMNLSRTQVIDLVKRGRELLTEDPT